jgi:fructoselysine-6-P-deglycase FrlB-like protein
MMGGGGERVIAALFTIAKHGNSPDTTALFTIAKHGNSPAYD